MNPPRTTTIPKYNSKTGEGTMSYFARAHGTSVDSLMKLNQGNPSVKSKDLIYAGGTLNLPGTQVQQSTASLRQETEKRNADFDRKQAEQEAYTNEISAEAETTTDSKTREDEVEDTLDTTDAEALFREQSKKDIDRVSKDYERVQKRLDRAHRELVGGIKQTYGARIEKMEDSNNRLLKLKEALGIRQGRERYSPVLQAGILTDEEMTGHERVMEIEGQMLSAVAEANAAKETGDYARLNDLYDRIDARTAEMNEQIQSNFDNAVKRNQEIEKALKAERDEVQSQFDRALDRSEKVAPAVAEALESFATDEERSAFLEAYSTKTGIPMDILAGVASEATMQRKKDSLDLTKKQADIRNVENTIADRNSRNTLAWQKEARLAAEEDEEEEDVTDATANILSGVSTLADIDEDSEDYQTVKAELESYGLYSQKPPQWFLDEFEAETKSSPTGTVLQSAWEKYRQERGII